MGIVPIILVRDMKKQTHPVLKDIDAFLKKTGMSETQFGLKSLNDGKLVGNLRAGRRLWPETETNIRVFIKQQTDLNK